MQFNNLADYEQHEIKQYPLLKYTRNVLLSIPI